jgi:hypothetical protein
MRDIPKAIRDHLLGNAPLVALVGARVYASRDVPPPGYDPSSGACLTFKVRGGDVHYSDAIYIPSVQFKCYGATETAADAVYRALYDALHSKHGAVVRWGQIEVLGQPLAEPQTGWPFVYCAFRLWITV